MKSRSGRWLLSLAALAMVGAIVTPAALAVPGKFTTNGAVYPAILTGDQDGGVTQFVIGKGVRTVTCPVTQYDATIGGPVESLTVTPTYGGCAAAPGILVTHVRTHQCTYTLTVPNVALAAVNTDITNCPEAEPIEIEITQAGATLCIYQIKNQAGLAGVTWVNRAGPPEDITLEIGVEPAVKVLFGTKIACGAGKEGVPLAQVRGDSTVRAYEDNGVEGNQIGVMIG